MSNKDIVQSIEEGQAMTGHQAEILESLTRNPKTIVILDDDPTGTQTIYGVPVITQWTEASIEKEMLLSSVFFILTNSRSLQKKEADELGEFIGKRLKKIANNHHKDLIVISRGDSTLRGHYPNEVNALEKGLEWKNCKHILIPAFFEGGRYTYDDIHYVKESEVFIPAAETPFAKDNTFGYTSSNLKDWIIEKSQGKIKTKSIQKISIDQLRTKPTEDISTVLEDVNAKHILVNATSYYDLRAIAHATLNAKGHFIFRTAASFVNAISGILPGSCLTKNEILTNSKTGGALIIIGSYVPKTTQQLNYLKEHCVATFLELDVKKVLDSEVFEKTILTTAKQIDDSIKKGGNVVLYTSRNILKGETKAESLKIVNLVSEGIISILKKINNQPSYIVAKGGITSSDVATKALSVERAIVLGQILKGVPVWKLGNETKFPNTPYIIFPGNVGEVDALHKLIKKLE